MGSKICMNEVCRTTTSSEWKNGWGLKSGGYATLCYSCGTAFEKFSYCDSFHLEEDGWRGCRICRKRVHCGCVASKMMLECLDFGGVGCVSCVKRLDATHATPIRAVQMLGDEITNGTFTKDVVPAIESSLKRRNFDGLHISHNLDMNGSRKLLKTQKYVASSSSLGHNKGEGGVVPFGELNTGSPHFTPQPVGSSMFVKPESHRPEQGVKEMHESLPQQSLTITLNNPLPASSSVIPFSEGNDQNKASSPQRIRQVIPKPPKPSSGGGSDASRGTNSQARVARPPAEGRGRSQLLPRYWPRITEQELQQISGELKSTIVPLFEKVLSASDAGRIGRLVLPKACAEAYFPPINQSEGLPIRIQDIKGKEWTFQFRFWPNNNSRMYVLEGVTPCIQNMQLQAGDTVTFSRIDPGGQLVIGFRKSTSNNDIQDPQHANLHNSGSSGDNSHSGASEPIINGTHVTEEPLQRQTLIAEKKKARNIGKNKRLLMPSDDAIELRVTWEEAQDLLRPHPMNSPTIIKIENYEIEEYDEPPIFGKKTVFTMGAAGDQEQWTQCDSCSKWRKLPVHVFVSARWTCSDNICDSNRSSCSAPDEINPREQEALTKASKELKRRLTESKVEDCEPSGLDALATAAVLGDNVGDLGETSVGATTKHPRHRPGCSCIVCIQPPSGKGKHPPNCKCTVCLTVKRRFKTLMQRKKKRQSDREAELAQGLNQESSRDASEMEGAEVALLQMNQMMDANERRESMMDVDVDVGEGGENGKGQLDLNSHPGREDDMFAEAAAGISMDSVIDAARIPLDMYLRQNGLSTLGGHGGLIISHIPSEGEGPLPDEGGSSSADGGADKKADDE